MKTPNFGTKARNSYYFNDYKFSHKLLPLLFCGCLFACSGQKTAKQSFSIENLPPTSHSVININTASVEMLEKLPHIGNQTARKIVEHRENFGKFRKPEHLLWIRGISDVKFRELRNSITVE